MKKNVHWLWLGLLACAIFRASAADKLTVTINNQTISAWRTADLESAKQQAAAEHKPIAWIASSPQYLNGTGKISSTGSQGATLHALYALRSRTVLVFEDGFGENHKVLSLVDNAVHTPSSHPVLPVVVFLDPAVTQVLAKAPFESDFVKRAHALADALEQAETQMNSASAPKK